MTPAVLLICGPIVTSLVTIVVAQSVLPLSEDIKAFTAFVLAGAAFGVSFSYLLFDQQEKRRQTAARCIIGAVLGVAIPRALQKYFHWLTEFMNDPILVIATGFVCSFVAYYIAYSIFSKLAKRERAIADAAVNAGEKATKLKFGGEEKEQ